MTPQERAAELAEQISGAYHQLDYPGVTVRSLVLEALTATRRAALLEAAEIAKECAKERRKEEEKYGEHVKNDPRSIWASCRASEAEVIVAKIDRLAQEG